MDFTIANLLYKVNPYTNKRYVWRISISGTPYEASILIANGEDGGALKTSVRYIKSKNLGKVNETSCLEQAEKEATSKYRKKLEQGYSLTGDTPLQFVKPMLAYTYENAKSSLKDGEQVLAQPKLNGVRCICYKDSDDTIRFYSRTGKEYTALQAHTKLIYDINLVLNVLPPATVLDGEIYMHGIGLQDIVAAVKDFDKDTLNLEYWVYDIVSTDVQFKRTRTLSEALSKCNLTYVKGTPTKPVEISAGVIEREQEECLQQGYEGLMIRKLNAPYKHKRTKDLIKYKNFQDKEFKIIGATESNNHEVIWICRYYGEPFNVVPIGTSVERKQLWIDADKFFGKMLTVRFSDISKRGVPIGNPVGVCIRDYE